MATIGTLIAELGLETAAFHRDMGKAVASLQSGSAQMNRSLAGIERQAVAVRRAAVGMLGVFSVAAFKAAFDRSVNLAESIGDLAKNTRLSTSAVQELQFAVAQSGGSVEGFSNAITHFNRTIGEAVNGSVQARAALARVGITLQDLQRQSIEQLWVRANDSLSKYAGSGRAAADVQTLFGREARASASAFSLAATELEGLRQTARATGQVLDESFIRQASQAKDELEKFGRVIDVNLTQAMLNFAPYMVKFTKFLSESSKMLVWMGQNMGLLSVTAESDQYDRLLERGMQLREEIHALEQNSKSWLNTLLGSTPQATQRLAEARAELTEINRQILERANKPTQTQQPDAPAAGGMPLAPAARDAMEGDQGLAKLEEQLRNRILRLSESYLSEREQLAMHIEQTQMLLDEAFVVGIISETEYQNQRVMLAEQAAAQRTQIEGRTTEAIMALQASAAQNAAGVLQAFAGKSKAAAVSVIAINKALAIAQIKASTAVAVMRAFADLGPIAGAAAAAKLKFLGAVNIGLVAASGFAEAANLGSNGADIGTPANPVSTRPAIPSLPAPSESGSSLQLQIIVEGNIIGNEEYIDQLVVGIRDRLDNRDVVLFGGRSRQAREIVEAV